MDPEAKAISDIIEILSPLEPDRIQQVLKFVLNRFQVKQPTLAGGDEVPPGAFQEFYQLYDSANPATGIDKVLVAGYWFQVVLGHEEFDSFLLNKELKNLGHPSSNITRDLDVLINKSPRLVTHGRKEGGRRRYKLTREGIVEVERMLHGSQNQESNSATIR